MTNHKPRICVGLFVVMVLIDILLELRFRGINILIRKEINYS